MIPPDLSATWPLSGDLQQAQTWIHSAQNWRTNEEYLREESKNLLVDDVRYGKKRTEVASLFCVINPMC